MPGLAYGDWMGMGQAVGSTLGLITVSARRNGMEWDGINWVMEGPNEWDGTGPAMLSICYCYLCLSVLVIYSSLVIVIDLLTCIEARVHAPHNPLAFFHIFSFL